MRRNVFILDRGEMVTTIQVKLDKDAERYFISEALRLAFVQDSFRGRTLSDVEFTVSAPLDEEK